MTKVKIETSNDGFEYGYDGNAMIGIIRTVNGEMCPIVTGTRTVEEEIALMSELFLAIYNKHGFELADHVVSASKRQGRRQHLEKQLARFQKELDRGDYD